MDFSFLFFATRGFSRWGSEFWLGTSRDAKGTSREREKPPVCVFCNPRKIVNFGFNLTLKALYGDFS